MGFFVGGVNSYEIPFRPPFELHAAGWWVGAALATVPVGIVTQAPIGMTAVVALGCLAVSGYRFTQGYPRYSARARLNNYKLSFCSLQDVADKMDKESMWLGEGFVWDKDAANRAYEVLRRGPEYYSKASISSEKGAVWIQNLKTNEENRVQLKSLEGHTLITGTTGAGKTRLLDIIVSQLIMRNDGPVIVIDPKGDQEMKNNMQRAYSGTGRVNLFSVFDPAHAKTSCRIDPCKNWNRGTEIPSRITDMMAGKAGDPFVQMAWNALNTGVQGMVAIGENPNLRKIRNFIEVGAGPLLQKVLFAHFAAWSPDWESQFASSRARESQGKSSTPSQEDVINSMVEFYKRTVSLTHADETVDALVTMFAHDRDHFQKLMSSLVPILAMITSDVLGDLLSPDYADTEDEREILDFSRVVRDNRGLYLALDSLSDGTVASAIGSMMLADLAAVAGNIYNFTGKEKPVYLVIDESAEVLGSASIRLLNKGRGAGFQVFMATQTISDFEVRLGDKASALQALGNVNNIITLRIIDPATQEYITDQFPKFMVENMSTSHKESTGEFGAVETNRAGYSESLEQEYLPLIEPSVLGSLPDLEYMAKLKDGRVLKGRIPIVQS